MTTPPPPTDPIDVAAAFPRSPAPGALAAEGARHNDLSEQDPDLVPVPVDRIDATSGLAEVVLSAERLTASTEWTVTGGVRFRRRITTSTRTVDVTVRRKELQVEVRDVVDHHGAWVGAEYRGPAVPAPPVVMGPGVFVLREEVPEVTLRVVPYERVIVEIDQVTERVHLTETARREQARVSGDTGTSRPTHRT